MCPFVHKHATYTASLTAALYDFSQSRAGELNPQRRQPGESDLQGAPASLLSGEGGFQQGQGVAQTDGAGERAQHQVVGPSLSPPQRHPVLGCS